MSATTAVLKSTAMRFGRIAISSDLSGGMKVEVEVLLERVKTGGEAGSGLYTNLPDYEHTYR